MWYVNYISITLFKRGETQKMMPLEWGGDGRRWVKGEKSWDSVASARESGIY